MKFTSILIIIFTLLFTTINFSQRGMGNFGGSVTGQVIDNADSSPVEYANVVLFNLADSMQANGTISNEQGIFKLEKIRPGTYYLKVSFIGYESIFVESFEINRNNRTLDLGEILLPRIAYQMEEAEVTADKPPIEYKIDKKVVNAAEYYSATTGTAVDILENVPSITVDIEGNVQLRGSGSFTVLIDGRPTILDANDALQQISANMIENIEIITNPSAKFDSEGETGIINIILKEERSSGITGIVNMNAGFDDKYGGDFLFNYRNSKFSVNLGGDYNNRTYPGSSLEERKTFINDTTIFTNSSGSNDRDRLRWGLKGGIDYNLTPNDLFSFSIQYGSRSYRNLSNISFAEFTDPVSLSNYYLSRNDRDRGGTYYAGSFDYDRKFNNDGHLLKAQIYFSERDFSEESINELVDNNDITTSGRKLTEDGPSESKQFKVDYELPFNETNKFEAGGQLRFNKREDNNNLYDYLPAEGLFILQPQFSSDVNYDRNIHALYGIYSGEINGLGYQAGLRSEYTDRTISLVTNNNDFEINRWDYFPTLHFSYEISAIQQVMLSYTSRIRRPRGWQLEPFETWTDAFNVRKGNPGLKPQYIDSFEMGLQTFWKSNLISLEAYYRKTNNNIERIRSVYESNVTLSTYENIGTTSALGGELMLNSKAFPFWTFNLLGNFYHYEIDGTLGGKDINRSNFNWNVRLNNTFIFDNTTRVQINSRYNAPSVSAQGEREGYFSTSFSIRKDLLDKMLTATLQVRDVFSTAKWESSIDALDFSSYSEFKRKSPMVMLNLKFNINHYKNDKKRNGDRDGGGDDEGLGEEF
ncbi:MAG: TonB-dependent receptor [Ignavibacteriae bacterium]|nr:TonB-dependent receptor [Ignavibacteriota bacterium]NOG98072.1 TonB-dependent receptor [Ignavibacteriota bacterium]